MNPAKHFRLGPFQSNDIFDSDIHQGSKQAGMASRAWGCILSRWAHQPVEGSTSQLHPDVRATQNQRQIAKIRRALNQGPWSAAKSHHVSFGRGDATFPRELWSPSRTQCSSDSEPPAVPKQGKFCLQCYCMVACTLDSGPFWTVLRNS